MTTTGAKTCGRCGREHETTRYRGRWTDETGAVRFESLCDGCAIRSNPAPLNTGDLAKMIDDAAHAAEMRGLV